MGGARRQSLWPCLFGIGGYAVARELTEGQRAYEAKRAAKAGMSLDKWLQAKDREQQAAEREQRPAPPKKPPGMISRWLDRAHKPIGVKKS